MNITKLNKDLLLYAILCLLVGIALFVVICIDYHRMKSVLPLKPDQTTVDIILGLYYALEFKLLVGVAAVWIIVRIGLVSNFLQRRE